MITEPWHPWRTSTRKKNVSNIKISTTSQTLSGQSLSSSPAQNIQLCKKALENAGCMAWWLILLGAYFKSKSSFPNLSQIIWDKSEWKETFNETIGLPINTRQSCGTRGDSACLLRATVYQDLPRFTCQLPPWAWLTSSQSPGQGKDQAKV